MKVCRATRIFIIMILFLPIWVSYAQSSTMESYNKGVEYAIQGKFEEAKKKFGKALKIDVENTTAIARLKTIKNVIEHKAEKEAAIHLFKGVAFVDRVKHDQAVKEFTRAIEISPRFVEAYLCRGLSYDVREQYDQAIKDYTKSIEIDPRDVTTYLNRGLVYDEKGQYDQAAKDYTKAVEMNPICKPMVDSLLLHRNNRH